MLENVFVIVFFHGQVTLLDRGYSVGGSLLISEALYQTRAVVKNHHKMGLIWRITFLAFRVKKKKKICPQLHYTL